jgi:hypothetical protein
MPDNAAHDAHVLDGLAEAVERSRAALEACAEAATVREAAFARTAAVAELRASAPAEAPAHEGLIERAAHALERLTDGGSAGGVGAPGAGALDALAREEDALQARFEAALGDDRLSGPARDAVLRAYDRVKPGHDAVRQAALSARGES